MRYQCQGIKESMVSSACRVKSTQYLLTKHFHPTLYSFSHFPALYSLPTFVCCLRSSGDVMRHSGNAERWSAAGPTGDAALLPTSRTLLAPLKILAHPSHSCCRSLSCEEKPVFNGSKSNSHNYLKALFNNKPSAPVGMLKYCFALTIMPSSIMGFIIIIRTQNSTNSILVSHVFSWR